MKDKDELVASVDFVYHNNITANNLRGISTPSEDVAWISGANGTVICTVDGGANWSLKKVPNAEQLDFRDIKAFDKNTAYVMSVGYAKDSSIYKTNDGGQSWKLQLQGQNISEFFNCMAFWNQNHGLVLSDPIEGKFKLYVTQDGDKWSAILQDGMPVALSGEGAFAASGSCMTVYGESNVWFGTGANTARVFSSIDGGYTWNVLETPIKKDNNSSGIFSLTFSDLKNGMISGGDYNNPDIGGSNLARTNDGGMTWKLASISPQFYWSSIALTPDKKNFMVVGSAHAGYAPSLFYQEDSNSNRSEVTQSAASCESEPKEKVPNNIPDLSWKKSWNKVNFNAFSFWKKERALAVGPKGLIVEIEIPTQSV